MDFVQKNKKIVIIGAVVLALIVVGVVISMSGHKKTVAAADIPVVSPAVAPAVAPATPATPSVTTVLTPLQKLGFALNVGSNPQSLKPGQYITQNQQIISGTEADYAWALVLNPISTSPNSGKLCIEAFGSTYAVCAKASAPGYYAGLSSLGEFILGDQQGNVIWRNNIKGGDSLIMQGDGNLVVYKGSTAIWAQENLGSANVFA